MLYTEEHIWEYNVIRVFPTWTNYNNLNNIPRNRCITYRDRDKKMKATLQFQSKEHEHGPQKTSIY